MAVPTNLTALTAIDLGSLPASTTLDVHDSGTTYTVWYAYTAGETETWVSAWAKGLGAYTATLTAWLGPASAPVAYRGIQSAANRSVQLEVTPGTTYYFKITPNAGHPNPAILEISVLRGSRYSVPRGAIAVNDDSEGFPLVFIDITTGLPINARTFPAGEAADTPPNGTVLAANAWDVELSLHDASMNVVGTLPYAGAAESFGFVRAHAATETFFVGDRSTGDVRTVNSVAVFGGTIFGTGADVTGLAANLDATLLYVANAALDQIEAWNLVTNSAAGAFVADPVGYFSTDLFALDDGTVLVNYAQSGLFATAQLVIHYSAGAAVLHTYTFDEADMRRPAGTPARIASDPDGPETFWIWTHHEGGVSKFRQIRISDGVTLQTVETVEFTGGASTAPDGSEVRFGHSFSCTFWVVREPIPDIDGPPPWLPPEVPARSRRSPCPRASRRRRWRPAGRRTI